MTISTTVFEAPGLKTPAAPWSWPSAPPASSALKPLSSPPPTGVVADLLLEQELTGLRP